MDRKELLGGVKRIVVKIGTSTLANADGSLNEDKIKQIVANLSELNESSPTDVATCSCSSMECPLFTSN